MSVSKTIEVKKYKGEEMLLGVNVDHIATLRNLRGTIYPSPAEGALIAQKAGADSIVMHLREDRRHIKDADLYEAKKKLKIPLNLEMALSDEIINIALDVKPAKVTIVPERRKEVTTEGGLDVIKNKKKLEVALKKFRAARIDVSLFIDADPTQVFACKNLGINTVEFHTGHYADAPLSEQKELLLKIKESCTYADELGIFVAAGHGLNLKNVKSIYAIKQVKELNIGHSIICDSVFYGLEESIKRLTKLIK